MLSDPNFDQELGISRIGEFLLKGMVLTDLNCSKCKIPTMRSKDKKVIGWCVLCDYVDQSVPVVKKPRVYAADPNVDVSKELGLKLMQGWTMLQECCNNCVGVPLMKSQDEEYLCVSCQLGKFVDQNGVHDLPPAVKEKAVGAAMAQNAEIELADANVGAELDNIDEQEDQELNLELEQISREATISTKNAPSSAALVIKEKLDLLTSNLAKATYPKEIQEICDAIRSASEALKSLS